MRFASVAFVLSILALGCGGSDGPKDKYYYGEPVDHWLEASKSPDAKVRTKAATVLGNIGPVDPRAIPALIEAVKDRDAKVRAAAVLGLSKIGPAAVAAEAVLGEAARDKDASVRTHAATALERIRGTK